MAERYSVDEFKRRCNKDACSRLNPSAESVLGNIWPLKLEALLDPALESSLRSLRKDLSFRNRKECMSKLRSFPTTFGAPGEETLYQRLQDDPRAIQTLEQLKKQKRGWVGYDYRNYYQDADDYLSEQLCNTLLSRQKREAIDKAIRDDMAALRTKLAQLL